MDKLKTLVRRMLHRILPAGSRFKSNKDEPLNGEFVLVLSNDGKETGVGSILIPPDGSPVVQLTHPEYHWLQEKIKTTWEEGTLQLPHHSSSGEPFRMFYQVCKSGDPDYTKAFFYTLRTLYGVTVKPK